eukprot:6213938-Prymnesium_polylepis.1
MFGVAGVRGVRACVYRHQPLSDAAAWAWKRVKSAISTAVNYVKSVFLLQVKTLNSDPVISQGFENS